MALGGPWEELWGIHAPGLSEIVYIHKEAQRCNRMQKNISSLFLQCVLKGLTHQACNRATFEDPWFEDKVAAPTWGALPTPPGIYNLKLLKEIRYHILYNRRNVCASIFSCCFSKSARAKPSPIYMTTLQAGVIDYPCRLM